MVDENLYIVWKAVCVVTCNSQYFGLLQEMVSWHFDMLKRERFQLSVTAEIAENSIFGPEMSSYLLIPFEEPTETIK